MVPFIAVVLRRLMMRIAVGHGHPGRSEPAREGEDAGYESRGQRAGHERKVARKSASGNGARP